jgi:hypothetical protein
VLKYNTPAYVFSGRNMIPGIALSLIHATRGMSQTAKDRIFGAKNEDDLNNVMNGMFRPEVKVPRFLITDNFQEMDSVKRHGRLGYSAMFVNGLAHSNVRQVVQDDQVEGGELGES